MAADPRLLLRHVRALVPGPSLEQASDADLLDCFIRSRDEDAFAALVARHGMMVYGVCRRVLRDATAAEDVAQAAFLMLARKASSIRRPETLAVWLHQTARRLALKYRRDDARRRSWESRRILEQPPRATTDPLDELSVRELLAIFDEELQELPDLYRLPLILCCLEDCTKEEAAKRLGWTTGSVKGRLERGRALLHSKLVRRGVSLSAALVGLEAASVGASAATFVAATTRAALLFASAASLAESGVAREVVAMAEEGIRSTVTSKTKILLSLLLVVGMVATGVAAIDHYGQAGKVPPEKPEQSEEKPAVRFDRHGDALPAGALTRLGTVRWRTDGDVEAMAFTPDGKTVIAGTRSGIYLFDVEGKLVKLIRPAPSFFEPAAFSPDGKRVLCRIREKQGGVLFPQGTQAQIWDLASGRKTAQYKVDVNDRLLWPAEGEPLSVRLEKGEMVFRDLATGKERRSDAKDVKLRGPSLYDYAFVSQSKLLAVHDEGGVIHLWDVSTGKKRSTLKPKDSLGYGKALSPDGRWMAYLIRSGKNNEKTTVQLWDLKAGKSAHTLPVETWLVFCAFSPDSKTLVVKAAGEIRFHDVATGRERGRSNNPVSGRGWNFAFSPDGKTLATAVDQCATIQLWDVGKGVLKPALAGHFFAPYKLVFAPDGRLVSHEPLNGSPKVWELRTGKPLAPIVSDDTLDDFDFSADGRTMFYLTSNVYEDRPTKTTHTLTFADIATGRILHTLNVADPGLSSADQQWLDIYLSDNRKTLVASGSYTKEEVDYLQFAAWDVASRKQVFRRRVNHGWLSSYNVSPNLKLLAVAPAWRERANARREPVRVEDLATGQLLSTLPEIKEGSRVLSFSPDSRLLATDNNYFGLRVFEQMRWWHHIPAGSTLRLWEAETGGEVLTLPSEDTYSPAVAFSPNRRLLALAGRAQTIIVWDLWRGKEWQRFSGFAAEVVSLAFSPDGQSLVSGLSNSTLLVWKVRAARKTDKTPQILDEKGVERAWSDLTGEPRKAFAARGTLALSPEKALPLLRERLKPIPQADPRLLRRLLADLDSDTFAVREKARKELEELGDRAKEALEQALKKKPSLEAHRRMEALLDRMKLPVTDPQMMRILRAVAVLEDIGTPEAIKLLKTLATGSAEARLTKEAKAAQDRLARRSRQQPRE